MKTGRDTVIEALNLARMGETGRASRLLQAMRNQPELEADACYGLGLIELCQNNVDNSEAYFCKATVVDPSHADAYYQLAKIADSRGDPVTATLYLKSAIAQKPGHVMAAEALAEHGVDVNSRSYSEPEPMRRNYARQMASANTNTKHWGHDMNKIGLTWKTLISMITLVVLTLGVIQEAGATRYKRATLTDLVRHSAVVMIGTVVGIEYREDRKTGEIFTDIKIRPIRSVYGDDKLRLDKGETFKLPFSGGLNAKGQMELVVGLPELNLGQTYLLFLRGGEWSLNPIAGWTQGALRLVAIEKGGDHVMFNADDAVVTGLKDGYLAYAPMPQQGPQGGPGDGDCRQKPARIDLGSQLNPDEFKQRESDSIYREDNVEELQKLDEERQKGLSEKQPTRDRLARMRELLGEKPMMLSDLIGQVKELRSGMRKDLDPKLLEYHPMPIPGLMRSAPVLKPRDSHKSKEGE